MRRQLFIFAVLLMGAVLTGVIIIGSIAARAPATVSVSGDAEQSRAEQYREEQADFSKWAQAHQPMEQPEAPASPVHSSSTRTPANDNPPVAIPVAANVPIAMDERQFYKISDTNPAVAVELATRIDPSQRPPALMENLVQRWADADLLAAAVWVEQETTGDEQQHLLQRIGSTLSQTEPLQAAEFVMTQIPPGPAQNEAVMTVVNQWGYQNLAAAAAWVGQLPEGPLQERAVNELEGIMNYRQALVHP